MKKYYLIGGAVTFVVIFNLGYVFHEILMDPFPVLRKVCGRA
jgi:hypothetical protein